MPKKRVDWKQFPFTEAEKRDFDRFGCAFKVDAGVFHIDWRERTRDEALKAAIFACLGRVNTKEGPLALLAFDISLVRPLPRYSYFPFDLANSKHKAYLTKLTTTGEIKLYFVSRRQMTERVHRLSEPLRMRASAIYEQCLGDLQTYGADKYEFGRALELTERWLRIPELLERRLSEDDITEIADVAKNAARSISEENIDLAQLVVREAENSFGTYYQKNPRAVEVRLLTIVEGITYMRDLQRTFGGHREGLEEFLTNALASSLSRVELENVREVMKLAGLVMERASDSLAETEIGKLDGLLQVPRGIIDLVRLAVVAKRISPNALVTLAERLGITVEGKRGRPTKDYSRECELRMSGKTYTEIARQAVAERQELRDEFGGRDYDSLDRAEKLLVWRRIHQGVITHAERAGISLPSDANTDDEEKNV